MRLDRLGHLTYCSNIHPGETWDAVKSQLESNLPAVKRQLSPETSFGLGLRLSAEAATTLREEDNLAKFRRWLDENDLYVFTLNGFPYGTFHGQPVKAGVYRPDWRHPERLDYSIALAEILATLLPADVDGSISTVPGACKLDLHGNDQRQSIVDNLLTCAATLRDIDRRTGKRIRVALEPEPSCMLETVEETLAFFNDELFAGPAVARFAQMTGDSEAFAADYLRDCIGVCLDTCHAAVMFEEPLETARALQAAGIRIVKLQLTAALALEQPSASALGSLQAFSDPIYLHQTTVQRGDSLEYFLDLPEAINAVTGDSTVASLRSHFHVPVFRHALGEFSTTSPALSRLLQAHRSTPLCDHLEVETYTFDVLPEAYRLTSVVENICREVDWVRKELAV